VGRGDHFHEEINALKADAAAIRTTRGRAPVWYGGHLPPGAKSRIAKLFFFFFPYGVRSGIGKCLMP
jgi:hypothetical protein